MKFSFRVKIGIIILVLISFILFNFTPLNKKFKNFFYLISAPIQKFLWQSGLKISNFFEWVFQMKNLKEENKKLKLKIQELTSERVSLIELKKENEILRNALKIGLEKEFQLILVRVIGKDISQDTLLIDKGSKEGVKINFPVIGQEKFLVGKISEVYDNFSKVVLISDKKISFDAKISDKEVYGVIKGKGNLKLNLELVPKDKEIKEGDLVVTSAIGGIFPPGILIGEIKKIKKDDIQPFQEAEIKPNFEIDNLEFLFVIQK